MGDEKTRFAALLMCVVGVQGCATEPGSSPALDARSGDVSSVSSAEIVVEEELDRLMSEGAARAAIVVLDPNDGRILAISGRGPGAENEARREVEMASAIKPLTVAAALEAGLDPSSVFDGGRIELSPGHSIQDHRPRASLSVEDVIVTSSNVGAAKIVERVGAAPIAAFFSEVGAQVPSDERWRVNGTGIGVTMSALELASVYGAFANGGLVIEPTTTGNGTRRRVVTERTAHVLRDMLEAAVADGGTGHRARVQGHRVGGKTGTTERGGVIFAGIGPIEDPQFVIVVRAEFPVPNAYAGRFAAPSFSRVAAGLMR